MSNSRISDHIEGTGRIMITDHGTHPPEFWAQVTAEQIAPIGKDVVGPRRIAALLLQAKIIEALVPHHCHVHETEASKLAVDPKYCEHAPTQEGVKERTDHALTHIVEAAAGTEWQAHFADPAVQEVIHAEVSRMFASHQAVERSHHRGNRKEH